jgi:hypothetical protein
MATVVAAAPAIGRQLPPPTPHRTPNTARPYAVRAMAQPAVNRGWVAPG